MEAGGLELGVLGSLVVAVDGRPVPDLPQQERVILSVLGLQAGHPVPVEVLVDALWSERRPKTPRKSVQVLVSRLRHRLEPDTNHFEATLTDANLIKTQLIRTAGEAYVLAIEPDAVDAVRYERQLAEARAARDQGDLERAVELTDRAQVLWRGDPVPDLADTERGRAARAQLVELRLGAEEDRFQDLLDLGRHREVVGALEASLADNPLRERRWRQLMVALYRSGRQADALRAYQRIRTKLVDELGIEPGPDLQRLEAAIIAHDPALELSAASDATAALTTQVTRPTEAPLPDASLSDAEASGAWDLYRQAIDVAQEIGDPRLLGQSAVGAARVRVHLEVAYPPIIERLVQAREGLADDDPLRAEVDTALIREYLWAGRWDEAMRISQPS